MRCTTQHRLGSKYDRILWEPSSSSGKRRCGSVTGIAPVANNQPLTESEETLWLRW